MQLHENTITIFLRLTILDFLDISLLISTNGVTSTNHKIRLSFCRKKAPQNDKSDHRAKKVKTDPAEEIIHLSYPSLEDALATPFDKIKRIPRFYFGMKCNFPNDH
jgi:hypothetical protein